MHACRNTYIQCIVKLEKDRKIMHLSPPSDEKKQLQKKRKDSNNS